MTLDLHVVFEGKSYKSYQTKIPTSLVAMVDPINMRSYGGCGAEPVPCLDMVRVTGSNILRDPGFENHLANTPTGPDGETFAELGVFGFPHWVGPPIGVPPAVGDPIVQVTGWTVFENHGLNDPDSMRWGISTANPRSGIYHARYGFLIQDFIDHTIKPRYISPLGGTNCAGGPYSWNGTHGTSWSARVLAGDVVTVSAHMAVSDNTDGWIGQVEFVVYNEFFGSELTPGNSVTNTPLSAGIYTQCSHTLIMPAGAVWLGVLITLFSTTTTVDSLIDIDDCVLAVT